MFLGLALSSTSGSKADDTNVDNDDDIFVAIHVEPKEN